MEQKNVVIIGSGPAGLTAAIYAARAGLKPLVVDGLQAGGQLMNTTDVENYPGFPEGIQGPEMMELFRKQAARFGAEFVSGDVTRVEFERSPFKVWTDDDLHLAQTVIIATGARANYLGLDSEEKLKNRGVSACAVCDGALYRGKPVTVVGDDDVSGFEVAVDQALAVGVIQRVAYLSRDLQRLIQGSGRVAIEALARHEFHHEERPSVGFRPVEDGHDVGVVQRGGCAGFPQEACTRAFVDGVHGQHLDGHGALQLLVPCFVDDPHSAPAYLADQRVAA